MTSLLRRLLGLEHHADPEMVQKAVDSDRVLERERQEYRQIIQRVDSGTRVMKTWDSANRMSRGIEG